MNISPFPIIIMKAINQSLYTQRQLVLDIKGILSVQMRCVYFCCQPQGGIHFRSCWPLVVPALIFLLPKFGFGELSGQNQANKCSGAKAKFSTELPTWCRALKQVNQAVEECLSCASNNYGVSNKLHCAQSRAAQSAFQSDGWEGPVTCVSRTHLHTHTSSSNH